MHVFYTGSIHNGIAIDETSQIKNRNRKTETKIKSRDIVNKSGKMPGTSAQREKDLWTHEICFAERLQDPRFGTSMW